MVGSARTIWVAGVLLALVVAMWLPFGVHGTPQGDGWILKDRVSSGHRWFFSENPTRILIYVPWSLADLLTPDSFVGIHLLLILLIFGKALALFGIVRRLPGSHDGLAFLTAALSIVYPAGTALFARDENVDRHWAVLFLLLAVWLLMVMWRRLSWPWLGALWVIQALSLWTNEAILPPALAVPLLMLWMYGRSDPLLRRNTMLWLIVPMVNAFHNLVHHLTVALSPEIADAHSRAVTVLALDDGWRPMLESLFVAYRRHLVDGWVQAFGTLHGEPRLILVAGLFAACTFAVGLALWPRRATLDRTLLAFLVVAGFVTIGLGFAPFVPTELRWTSGRSFIISSLGAVLVVPAVVAMLGRRSRWARPIAVTLIAGLALVGASSAFAQHARYNRGAMMQDRIFASIIEQAPRVRADVFFAVKFTGEPPALRRAVGLHRRSNILRHALRYLYNEQSLSGGLVDSNRFTAVADRYQLTREGVGGSLEAGQTLPTVSYEDVLIFRVRRSLEVKLLYFLPRDLRGTGPPSYRPRKLIDDGAPLPPRWRIVAHPDPIEQPELQDSDP